MTTKNPKKRGETGLRTVVELVERRLQSAPSAAACKVRNVSGQWYSITWRERVASVRQFAGRLIEAGIQHGDRVAIFGPPCADWQLAEWGAIFAGGAVVGIDPNTPVGQLRELLATVSPRAVCVLEDEFLPRIEDLLPAKCDVRLLRRGEDARSEWISWGSSDANADRSTARDLPDVGEDHTATLIYTSGTAGTPKVVAYTHRQLMVACEAIGQAFPLADPQDPLICWLPMSHLFQRMFNLVAAEKQAVLHFVDDPRLLVESLPQVRPKVLCCVPRFIEKLLAGIIANFNSMPAIPKAAFYRILHDQRRPKWSLGGLAEHVVLKQIQKLTGGQLKHLICGSAPLSPAVAEQMHRLGWNVLEAYGVSENTVPMSANRPHDFRFGSVGKPFDANEIRIADDGEILVRGPGVFRGYVEEQESSLTSDGYYATGDIGRFDDDGFLYLIGRKSQVIKTSTGRKVYPTRVEAVYQQHPLLELVVVFGHGQKYLVGLILPNEEELQRRGIADQDDEIDDAIDEALRTQGDVLSLHEQIVRYVRLAEPLSVARGELTASLKVRRHVVADRYGEQIDLLFSDLATAVASSD